MSFSVSSTPYQPRTSAFQQYRKEVARHHARTFIPYARQPDPSINRPALVRMIWNAFLESSSFLATPAAKAIFCEDAASRFASEDMSTLAGNVLIRSLCDAKTRKPVTVLKTKEIDLHSLPNLQRPEQITSELIHQIAIDTGFLTLNQIASSLLEIKEQFDIACVPFAKGKILYYTSDQFDTTLVRQRAVHNLYPDVPALSAEDVMHGFQRLLSALSLIHAYNWVIPGFSIGHLSYQVEDEEWRLNIRDIGEIRRPGIHDVFCESISHYDQLAPESLFFGHYHAASDIFGLGIALLELYLPDYFENARAQDDGEYAAGSDAEKTAYLNHYVKHFGPLHEDFINALSPEGQRYVRTLPSSQEGAIWESLRVTVQSDVPEFEEFLISTIKTMICSSPNCRPHSSDLLNAASSAIASFDGKNTLEKRYKHKTELTVKFTTDLSQPVKIFLVPFELFKDTTFDSKTLNEFFGITLENITGGQERKITAFLPESKLALFSLVVGGNPSEGAQLLRLHRTPKDKENYLELNLEFASPETT